MKLKTVFVCSICQHQEPKFVGKCPSCGQWNTFVEDTINVGKPLDDKPRPTLIGGESDFLEPKAIEDVLNEIKSQKEPRIL
ncbi:MAG: hypothetical protein HC932_03040 [Thermales bacterium]|nr:hypothetical protein [Thermales bacterium]